MVRLNFMDLSEEAKDRLIQIARKEVEQQFGKDIGEYAKNSLANYEELIREEAQRKLYDYHYVFKV